VLNDCCFNCRQPKAQSQLESMKNNIKVYFQESSIHGFSYIVNRDLHIVEKLLWVVSLVISFICCGLLIYEIGVKFEEDAMVTYTSDTAIPIVDVSIQKFGFMKDFQSLFHSPSLSLEDSISCRELLS
jgi:hypothetical protein